MAFTNSAWDGDAVESRLEPGAYCSVCLIDMNEGGGEKTKQKCKLPVRAQPGGAYNLNAMTAAAGALAGARGGLNAPAEQKRKAARRLLRLYREAGKEAPAGVKRVAGS